MIARRFRTPLTHVCAGLGFCGASLLIHLPAWAAGLIQVEDDVKVFFFPVLVVTGEALAKGTLPFWTPGLYGGYPLFAHGQGGMLYPWHLLFLPWLAPEQALVALRIVHSALASLFCYALLRTLHVGGLGSFVGGLIYAYGGFAAGQLVHSSEFHSIVWLPLELALAERALCATGARRYRFAMLAGGAFGIQALAQHMQIMLMSALAVTAFLGYRSLIGGPEAGGQEAKDRDAVTPSGNPRRPWPPPRGSLRLSWLAPRVVNMARMALILAIIGTFGAGLGAVQLVPLAELGRQSARWDGLPDALAAVNSVWPGSLLTLLLPHLHDTREGGFWGPWVKWETVLYVGVLPLVLAVLGLGARQGRYWPFFGGLAILSVLIALGPNAPVPVWDMLHSQPGFRVLASPGRFSMLLALCVAVLAGYGVDWVARRPRAAPRAALIVALTGALLVSAVGLSLDYTSRTLASLGSSSTLLDDYLLLPGVPETVDDAPLTAARLGQYAAQALTTANPATAWQLALFLAAILTVAVWLLGRRARRFAACLTIGVVVADLWVLGLTFHPLERIADLRPVVPPVLLERQEQLFRVYTPPTADAKRAHVEPNRLLPAGVQEAGGYTSLEPMGYAPYAHAVQYADSNLLDLWNVRWVVQRVRPELFPSHGLTSFHPERPLLTGKPGTSGSGGVLLPEGGTARSDELRVVASLFDARTVPDGTPVARLILEATDGTMRSLELRAGQHLSDTTIAAPGRSDRVTHARATVAYDYYSGAQLFYAAVAIDPPMTVHGVTVENVTPVGGLAVYGLGLFDATTGEVTQVRDKAKYRLVYRDDQIRIRENLNVMPRAFLVATGIVVPPGHDVLSLMTDSPFDPRETVIIEGPIPPGLSIPYAVPGLAPSTQGPGDGTTAPRPASAAHQLGAPSSTGVGATIVSYAPEQVVVRTAAERDALLVLSDLYFPGWKTRVDGGLTPMLRANSLFRAVVVPAGTHTVTFSYEPFSIAIGAAITLVAACALILVATLHGLATLRCRSQTFAWHGIARVRGFGLRAPGPARELELEGGSSKLETS